MSMSTAFALVPEVRMLAIASCSQAEHERRHHVLARWRSHPLCERQLMSHINAFLLTPFELPCQTATTWLMCDKHGRSPIMYWAETTVWGHTKLMAFNCRTRTRFPSCIVVGQVIGCVTIDGVACLIVRYSDCLTCLQIDMTQAVSRWKVVGRIVEWHWSLTVSMRPSMHWCPTTNWLFVEFNRAVGVLDFTTRRVVGMFIPSADGTMQCVAIRTVTKELIDRGAPCERWWVDSKQLELYSCVGDTTCVISYAPLHAWLQHASSATAATSRPVTQSWALISRHIRSAVVHRNELWIGTDADTVQVWNLDADATKPARVLSTQMREPTCVKHYPASQLVVGFEDSVWKVAPLVPHSHVDMSP